MGRRKKAFSLYVRRVIRPGKKTPVPGPKWVENSVELVGRRGAY